jgi:hypothetical protein
LLGDPLIVPFILGQEYIRLQVLVHPLGPFEPVPVDTAASGAVEDSLIPADLPPLPDANVMAQTVPAQTYVWCQDDSGLDKELWSFEEFIQNNAWKWVERGARRDDYDDVDRVRERLRGEIIRDVITV